MNEDTVRTFRLLVAELAAIELWDSQLWLDAPHGYEIIAFLLRSHRRTEIIVQLVEMLAKMADCAQALNLLVY